MENDIPTLYILQPDSYVVKSASSRKKPIGSHLGHAPFFFSIFFHFILSNDVIKMSPEFSQ